MSDNSNNVHFSGVRFICFARAHNGKMRAANESYALKMNIIVIFDETCYGLIVSNFPQNGSK